MTTREINGDRWHRQWQLFHDARELPAAERHAFLEQQCDDLDLRREVADLLAASDDAEQALPTEGASLFAALSSRRQLSVGDRVDRYRIVRPLGEGGMGQVFLAVQEAPIERDVALKVIKRGMDSDEVVSRFASERQILARLNHPNIATVLDAGLTGSGQPFFVMEVVDGEPIDRYCDHRRLDLAQRVQLLIAVCGAVQHAHHKGIVHRDLKPSNVLVAEDDDRQPVAKVIDFGIAKALDHGDGGARTELGRVLGTPDFMSPEQLAGDGRDVDSRTDIYALGVLLYLLVAGCLPHDRSSGASPRPSGLGATTGRSSAAGLVQSLIRLDVGRQQEIAEQRRLHSADLLRRLRGELEWIVDRAMADDREQRYASCSELAADLERHLRGEAVLAGPPSVRYRAAKLFARYRPQFLIAGTSLLLLIALAIGLALQSSRLSAALDDSRAETARRQQVTDFLVDTFRVYDPDASTESAELRNRSAREVLDDGAMRVLDQLDDAELYGPLAEAIGRIYGNLGEYRREAELFEAAFENESADDPLELARRQHVLGVARSRAGDWSGAEHSLRSAFDLRRSRLGPDDAATIDSEEALAVLAHRRGDNAEARVMLERVLKQRLIDDDGSSIEVARTRVSLANVLRYLDEFDRSIELNKQALEQFRRLLPTTDRRITGTLNGLAVAYERVGRIADAEQIYRQILEREGERLGPAHPDVAAFKVNLSMVLVRQRRFEDAVTVTGEALVAMRNALGDGDLRTLQTARTHAVALFWSGQQEAAITSLFDIQRRMEALVDIEHAELQSTLALLANLLMALERWQEAEPLLARLMQVIDLHDRRHTASGMRFAALWGDALSHLGQHARGEALMTEALEFRLEQFGADHRKTLHTWGALEAHFEKLGKRADIDAWRVRLEIATNAPGPRG